MSLAIAVPTLCLSLLFSPVLNAKEYNESTHIKPEQRAKVDKTIAKARARGASDTQGQDLVLQGVNNTGCGKLEIGRVETGTRERKYGTRLAKIDRDIIITGDVINVATGCSKKSGGE